MDRSSILPPIKTAVCAGMFAIVSAGTAHAVTVHHFLAQNGGNACTGALPTYEGSLRKRPKAIVNVGDVPAFATCSAMVDGGLANNPKKVVAIVTNRSAAPVDLTCTMVNGEEYFGANYVVSTKSVPVNDAIEFTWVPLAPKTSFDYTLVGISCLLPPDVEIDTFGYYQDDEV